MGKWENGRGSVRLVWGQMGTREMKAGMDGAWGINNTGAGSCEGVCGQAAGTWEGRGEVGGRGGVRVTWHSGAASVWGQNSEAYVEWTGQCGDQCRHAGTDWNV